MVQAGALVTDQWHEGFSMTTISRLENTSSEHFYRILILTALIKEDVEDLNEGVIETQDPTVRGTLTDMTS